MQFAKKTMPAPNEALAGRLSPIRTADTHFVNGNMLKGPFPEAFEEVVFALGCFWGAERAFWQLPGVHVTAVGYSGGFTRNATYEEVCSGRTGHTEVVRVIYDPAQISFTTLLKTFWESHDPTQGMQQGNDGGTQYRSAIYTTTPEQHAEALRSKVIYERELRRRGYRAITTEIEDAPPFFYAEEYHQQYLAKNPNGYCGIAGTGVTCPIGMQFKAAS